MTIDLSDTDHRRMDALIDTLIAATMHRRITPLEARSAIAHVITAAAIQNEGELRSWLRPSIVQRYIDRCDGPLCPCCRRKPCIVVAHFGVAL